MKKLLTLLLVAAAVMMSVPAFAAISGSPHEFTATAYGRCGVCHVPHAAATGMKRLWRQSYGAALTGWAGSNVGKLCYGCHGTGAPLYGGSGPTNVGGALPNIYTADEGPFADLDRTDNLASHGRNIAELTAISGSGTKPYMSNADMECTSCHNVHFEGDFIAANYERRPFLRTTAANMSAFCAECHNDRYNNNLLGAGNITGNHPVNIAYNGAVNNTILVTPAAAMDNRIAGLAAWSLGGKFQDSAGLYKTGAGAIGVTDQVGCQTCHAVHNPGSGVDQHRHLLAVNNATGTTAALCEGCHGNPTGNTARANSQARMQVGTTAGDHPIDCDVTTTDLGPNIDRWYVGDTTVRQERTELADTDWPHPSDGTYSNIVCTSCHSAHKARTIATSGVAGAGKLTRKGSTIIGDAVGGGDWCTACHADPSPAGHHSHSGNTPDGVYTYTSSLGCGDCHGGSNASFAHNGFNYNQGFAGNVANNANSDLCNYCHLHNMVSDPGGSYPPNGQDPVFGFLGAGDSSNAAYIPAGHLPAGVAASQSHYLGDFDHTSASIKVKNTAWANGYSKYGGNGTDTHGNAAPTVNAASTMTCESCHSVLHNAGVTGNPKSGGYAVNLLLMDYKDDSHAIAGTRAVGSGLCVACHNTNDIGNTATAVELAASSIVNTVANVPAGTHPMTEWTITRAVDAGRVPTTLINGKADANCYATATNAPDIAGTYVGANRVSYPGDNQMDCDSCHRPHGAPATSTYNQTVAGGGGVSRPVILEKQAVANEWADFCQECHGM